MQVLIFLVAVGDDVKNIPIGIVNNEHTKEFCNTYDSKEVTTLIGKRCEFKHLSCLFLERMNIPMLEIQYYNDVDNAYNAAKHGKTIGVVSFHKEFSKATTDKLNALTPIAIHKVTLDRSEIKAQLDMSNRQIGYAIKHKLHLICLNFQKELYKRCKWPPKAAEMPMHFKFLYGDDTETYRVYMLPGGLLSMIYFMGMSMTANTIIQERQEGIWDRTIVAGVSSLEIVLTHFIIVTFIVCMQIAEVLIMAFVIYTTDYVGPFILIVLFVGFNGLVGVMFGFFISVVSNTYELAHNIATGAFYPLILLCGIIWPVEAQPIVLRYISYCLPMVIPLDSLRSVMKKGWTLEDWHVIKGFLITIAWIVFLLALSVFLLVRKR